MWSFFERLKGRFTKINDIGRELRGPADDANKFGVDTEPYNEFLEMNPYDPPQTDPGDPPSGPATDRSDPH